MVRELSLAEGLDPYVGLFEIMRDYKILIPSAKDVEAQLKDKTVPKKSTGYWMFKSWDSPKAEKMAKFILDNNITKNNRFREGDIAKWAEQYPEFLKEIGELLKVIDMDMDDEVEISEEEVVED